MPVGARSDMLVDGVLILFGYTSRGQTCIGRCWIVVREDAQQNVWYDGGDVGRVLGEVGSGSCKDQCETVEAPEEGSGAGSRY